MSRKWPFFLATALLVLAFASLGYYFIAERAAFKGEGDFELKVKTSASISGIGDSLVGEGLKFPELFEFLSKRMNYTDKNLKPGLYEIHRDLSLVELIRHLRSGRQKPVNVTINSVRTIPQLAGKITRNLELDSLDFIDHLTQNDRWNDTTMTRFIPNTYKIYWNISAQDLLKRMDRERRIFFDKKDRRARCDSLGMTPTEVYIMASIVEQESTIEEEKPLIASVYLNRIDRGIKLQADPTVVFANQDFSIRRVLNKHLRFDSPYNTYIYEGLPPGPICMPSISSLDAVMYPADTDYIFFCARPGYQNGHAFASTLREHNNNARRYREWLRSEGIF
ncbi:MAG: endolytic transglycosylase MltG [Saprospiraceae bacterium]|nr:endolytic transglycosylase MltG [Saprospiraceae bacterium]